MDENLIDEVMCKQWVSVDITTLETISNTAADFVDSLCEKLEARLPHSFIVRQQSSFQAKLKTELKRGGGYGDS